MKLETIEPRLLLAGLDDKDIAENELAHTSLSNVDAALSNATNTNTTDSTDHSYEAFFEAHFSQPLGWMYRITGSSLAGASAAAMVWTILPSDQIARGPKTTMITAGGILFGGFWNGLGNLPTNCNDLGLHDCFVDAFKNAYIPNYSDESHAGVTYGVFASVAAFTALNLSGIFKQPRTNAVV